MDHAHHRMIKSGRRSAPITQSADRFLPLRESRAVWRGFGFSFQQGRQTVDRNWRSRAALAVTDDGVLNVIDEGERRRYDGWCSVA